MTIQTGGNLGIVVLVTASRAWRTSREMGVGPAFSWVVGECGQHLISQGPNGPSMEWSQVTLRHGAARGGDTHLARVAGAWGMVLDPHPVIDEDWRAECGDGCKPGHRVDRPDGSSYCPGAGTRRNQRMVDLGADICLGFPRGLGWSGTRDCMKRAAAAGIRVVDWPREGVSLTRRAVAVCRAGG